MDLPANLTFVQGGGTTSGTVGTVVTFTLLAAPAAGYRYRLWAVLMAGRPGNTGALWSRWRQNTASTPNTFAELDSVAKAGDHWEFPGGIPFYTAVGLLVDTLSDVATQTVFLYAYYTTELA